VAQEIYRLLTAMIPTKIHTKIKAFDECQDRQNTASNRALKLLGAHKTGMAERSREQELAQQIGNWLPVQTRTDGLKQAGGTEAESRSLGDGET
jgi:hypothetical protein